jgi:GTP-binding protein HflX
LAADSSSERVLLVSLVSDITESVPSAKSVNKLTPSARLARSASSIVDESESAPVDEGARVSSRIHSPTLEEAELAMVEFRELTTSAGGVIVGEVIQRRAKPDAATLIGKGKVQEVVGAIAATEAKLVLFDHDLTPCA